jgi:protein-S-isoprenylcysteine O-methyltransferase Ste14
MNLIKLFLLGASGYLLLGLFDLAQIKQKELLGRILAVGFLVTALPYPLMLIRYKSPHPPLLGMALLIMVIASALATIYVAALEIPLSHTGAGDVYRGGSYARTRHPGFAAHLTFNVLLSLYLCNGTIAILCLLFVSCNLALVTIEDYLFFPRLFSGYDEYKETTGFLLPKRRGHR